MNGKHFALFAIAATLALTGVGFASGRNDTSRRLAQSRPLPPSVQVCLLDGALPGRPAIAPVAVPRTGLATPSRAGVYDPAAPIIPQHLNWTVPGVGCVTYPGDSTLRSACGVDGGPALPVVHRALCQQ